MKIDKSLILTDEQVSEMNEEVAKRNDSIRKLEHEISDYRQRIIANYIEQAKQEKLEGIEFGDKVKVTRVQWGGWNRENTTVSEEGFLNTVFVDRFATVYPSKDSVRFKFAKPKKDGSPSLRYFDYTASNIVKIEKI